MSNLEEKVGNLEQTTKQEVTTQVSKMKDEIIDSLKEDINKVVDTRNRELEDRKRREMNITIFNLLEHDSDCGSDNKRADESDVRTISANLGLENLCITMTYRLGRKEEGKTRPLRVILDSKAQRKFLIENAKHIPKKTQENFQRVIIAKDLTPEQRRERRKSNLSRQKKQQKEQGQSASPMDARAVTPPTHQFIMCGPGIGVMPSDTMPSPIRNVETSIEHRSHLNAVNDSSLESQAYNQTTIVNSTNIDDTVLGGLTQHWATGYTQAPFEPR